MNAANALARLSVDTGGRRGFNLRGTGFLIGRKKAAAGSETIAATAQGRIV